MKLTVIWALNRLLKVALRSYELFSHFYLNQINQKITRDKSYKFTSDKKCYQNITLHQNQLNL